MAVFECPSCRHKTLVPEKHESFKTMCTKCGQIVTIAPTEDSDVPRKQNRQQGRRPKPKKKKGILIVAALGLAAAMMFALFAPESKPTKTEFQDLNQDEVDKTILAVGMSALADQGWTESETAFYIETRMHMLSTANREARDAYRSGGSGDGGLKAKSTASDIADLGQADLLQMREEIEDRNNRIKEFGRILDEYKKGK